MGIIKRFHRPIRLSSVGLAGIAALLLTAASCNSPHQPTRRAEANLDPGWPQANQAFKQVCYTEVQGALPTIPGAEFVKDDELCLTCHLAYTQAFKDNVHRGGESCEGCHGPASRHLETRGKEPGLIFSFKTADAATKAEMCLKCHQEDQCTEGSRWRTSKHAHCGVSCTDCHRAHYNVPEGTPATTEPTAQNGVQEFRLAAHHAAPQAPAMPSLRGTSNHLGAVAPNICYKCHGDMQQYQEIAGPHQICGPNGFNCTTCHDPHGKIREETRKDLCLQCHKGAPTMAFHSSIHNIEGVACTDCHNPHPKTCVPQVVNISHTDVRRPKRLQMSVQEPEACYKCHPKIFAMNQLPSHHPIKEGKMVCSDCHDPHGQTEKNLKEAKVNMVCYKCHADKQGPFAYQHPPVEENCGICHEPHGSITNNLLRQPATFLCLRCHSGHRGTHGGGARNDIDRKPWMQQAFYSNSCNLCHIQVHGSDKKAGNGTPFSR